MSQKFETNFNKQGKPIALFLAILSFLFQLLVEPNRMQLFTGFNNNNINYMMQLTLLLMIPFLSYAFVWLIFKLSYYEIKEGRLIIHTTGHKKEVKISQINFIKESDIVGNSIGALKKGLGINYGEGYWIYVQPKDERALVRALKNINPSIRYNEGPTNR